MMYLEKFNKAREAISLANSVDELAMIADTAEALRYAALQAKQSINVVNEASEIKFRAERRAGELIKEGQERGEIAKKGESKYNSLVTSNYKRTLDEIGINKYQSSKFQKVASLPEVEFDSLPTVSFHTNINFFCHNPSVFISASFTLNTR